MVMKISGCFHVLLHVTRVYRVIGRAAASAFIIRWVLVRIQRRYRASPRVNRCAHDAFGINTIDWGAFESTWTPKCSRARASLDLKWTSGHEHRRSKCDASV